ncbi:hypothetical protein JOD97_001976 [Duganella sp. 1411]|uniref:hypothetical protein n=1 Tax=Duganella sp. 1411 TaxID=2806572 RepID=UPI001AE3626B|nr:hypothetical protein [Duganella sp. 1411]MBP1203962.1 hypothetical protein [Duganella sp. 1411]
MKTLEEQLLPDPDSFASDPFGYSAMAWMKWAILQNLHGFDIDPSVPPTSEELKSPVLWLSQAHALSQAAALVLRGNPDLETLPLLSRGICDSQYRAVGLMLVGYSLEICLKGMLIVKKGVTSYVAEEKAHKHHKLVRLAEFIPELNAKEQAILTLLTHFLEWAGRYPDPGSGREGNAQILFTLSEQYRITAKDVFVLAAKVMGYARVVVA